MRFKTLPIFTLATYRMGSNFSIRVTPNINLITVGLITTKTLDGINHWPGVGDRLKSNRSKSDITKDPFSGLNFR